MNDTGPKVAIIVAHPDDETLWAGGTMLLHPEWAVRVVSLCRGGDPDRAPRFHAALARLNAEGRMADVDDEPEQRPLAEEAVRAALLEMVGTDPYDLVLSHGPAGEYTRHRRHEEVSPAVSSLWREGKLQAERLWLFAYEDGAGAHLPQARAEADLHVPLPAAVWREKYRVITEVYGFSPDSFEAARDATRGGVLALR